MSFVSRASDGPAVAVRKAARPAPLTREQVTVRRDALWLQLHEGRPSHSVQAVAMMFGLTPRAVYAGLDRARALRAEIEGADHA